MRSSGYGSMGHRKEYSPYQQSGQRPSSAGVARSRSRGHSAHGSSRQAAYNASSGNGHSGYSGATPVISAGLMGSGYQNGGRPPSAGTSRRSSSNRQSSSNHHYHQHDYGMSSNGAKSGRDMPLLTPQIDGSNQFGRSSGGSSRPKSAGVMRRSSGGHDGVNQQMYYQHQYMPNPDPQAQLAAQKQQHRAQQQHAQRAKNAQSQQQQHQQQQGQPGDDQWSTSYKLHFSYNKQDESGGQGAAPSALYMAAKPTTDKAVGQSANIQKMTLASTGGGGQQNPPKNQRPSSATARIRSAVDNSQKYAVKDPKDMSTSAQTTMSAAQTRELNTDTQEDGAEGTGAVNTEEGRQMLQRDDEEEMDGKRLDNNSAHPEVSTTTPSQSVELQSVGNVDVRNSSIGSLGEDLVDVGISTVPNQFCSCKDALDLRKLLLLSKGSRGGVVPSSTAVMDMYMVGKVVGVGSYGKVRAAWHRLTGSKVAIKTYDKSKLKDPAHWKRVHSEIKIMEQVSHPRIARMYEAVETPKRMHLIMECLDGGNLCSYVKAKRRLSEDESRRIFFQILQAVEHLHMLGVTHRDIKLENVLFADNRDIKLIDFGFSTVCQPGKRLKVFCGTPSYMAPEIVRRTEYEGKPVDMWSLGILLYALLCGCFPFRAKSYPDLYRRIARGTFAIPEELSASVKDLLRQFLTVDVSQRITAQAALRHSWLQAQFATTPDINKLRLETPILISDKPSDDIDEATLAELDKFGLGKDDVVRLILTKTHSSIASFYYLLLDLNLTKRRVLMAKRGMSGGFSKGRNSSSVGNDPYLVQQQQLQQSAGGGQGGFMRPKSASASRQSSNNPQRPLSAFSSRR